MVTYPTLTLRGMADPEVVTVFVSAELIVTKSCGLVIGGNYFYSFSSAQEIIMKCIDENIIHEFKVSIN